MAALGRCLQLVTLPSVRIPTCGSHNTGRPPSTASYPAEKTPRSVLTDYPRKAALSVHAFHGGGSSVCSIHQVSCSSVSHDVMPHVRHHFGVSLRGPAIRVSSASGN
ncbi:hypothetical protein SKAU_G00173930 [Synaphobranchus kaupii]|uniref:Uncharacterized protein n=1 Tax=Synaphobranchus kaupii TaxID=118154 RepID=A0A9Q1FLA1_SYNKA|nr:hypothetical protein SKAU_G00173930 [Synaphobranchus kaupii]